MDVYRLAHHAAQVAEQARLNQVAVVSSGSVACGRSVWRRSGNRHGWPDMQTLAMLGSAEAARAWQRALSEHGLAASQLLVTHRELDADTEGGSLTKALRANLTHGVVPLINENDAVSEQELAELAYGGDNDGLGAHIAISMQAGSLFLLTEAPAVLDEAGERVQEVACTHTAHTAAAALAKGGNGKGRGGMASKIAAASRAARAGIAAYIGSADDDLADIRQGRRGTYFLPKKPSDV